MKKLQVVYKRPNFPAEVVTIEDSLEGLQGLLDNGYLCGIRLDDTVSGYVDDEGLLKGLPLNFWLHGEPIVGPAVFSKVDEEGEEVGFTDAEEAFAVCRRVNALPR